MPLNLLPVFDWVNSDASYNANYSWERGTEDEEGNSYGNTINTQRELTLNGNFNLVKLYNHVPFLKKVNDKFDRTQSRAQMQRKKQEKKKKKQEAKEQAADPKKALPKNKRAFEREITLLPDTTFKIRHGKNTKRLIVNAKTEDGKVFPLKYKKVDNNQIRIISKVDTAMKVKLSVLAKEPLDDKKWYKGLQLASRLAMMVRNVSINYRSSYQLTLPGFLPSVGDAFGQKKVGQMRRQETTTGCSATTVSQHLLLPAERIILRCVPPWSLSRISRLISQLHVPRPRRRAYSICMKERQLPRVEPSR